MARHLRVKDLKKKLEKLPDDAKIIFCNDRIFLPGMYYATSIHVWKDHINGDVEPNSEVQVEIESNHKSIAKGWDYYGN
jgi:hypothetical protein